MRYLWDQFARFAGIVGVGFEWLALASFFVMHPELFDGRHPISYFASLPDTRWIFSVCYVLAAGCFVAFFHAARTKLQFRLPERLFGVSLASFVLLAIWPYQPTQLVSNSVHLLLFFLTATTFMVGMWRTHAPRSERSFNQISRSLAVTAAVVFVVFIGSGFAGLPQVTLPLEAGWWLVLQVWVIWVNIEAGIKMKNNHKKALRELN